jgi:ferrochelatase
MITGILLINLGTPDSPQPNDVRRYLTEFLTDERVMDVPWIWRQLLVRGMIIPKRYKQSAACYKQIWSLEGSPLLSHGKRVVRLLQEKLGEYYKVELAMRYRHPSIEKQIRRLLEMGIHRLVIIPLFPQYASATTGSVYQKVMEVLKNIPSIPEVSFVHHFYDHPGFIEALSSIGSEHPLTSYDHILFSYHGLPRRQLIKSDRHQYCLQKEDCCHEIVTGNRLCYAAQCHATTRNVAAKLNIPKTKFSISFQSRLGKEPWLQPYTNEVIHRLATSGKKKVLVFSPSFVCDCLETTYEIGIEYAAEFKKAGGEALHLVPGLNDHPRWIQTLQEIITVK